MMRLNKMLPEVKIGLLAHPTPGSFKIGPFGSSLKKDELVERGIPVASIENILPNKFSTSFRKFITDEKFEQLSDYAIQPDDILITTMGTIGRAAVAPHNLGIAIFDSHLFRMRVDQSKVYPPYLCYAINGYSGLKQQIAERSRGSIMAGLNSTILKECTIYLPTLPEQRRIAAILAEQLAAVERARAAAAERLEAAQVLPAAYLRAVFESEEAQGWPKIPLGDAGSIGAGITLGRSFDGIPTRRVPYLRVANVKDGYLDLSDVYEIDVPESDIEKCRLSYGDLLLTEGGDPDKLGRGTFWQGQISECIHQNHIFRVRFALDRFSPPFLSFQLSSSYGKTYFLGYAKQTTGIATINQRVLAGFPLMIPTLSEQQRIVALLNEQISAADHTRAALEAQLDSINALPAALLRRAFNGEL